MRTLWKRICTCIFFSSAASLPAADVADIRSILQNRIESGKAVGIVVGIIDAKGTQIIPAGKFALHNAQAPDGDTVYEIGSITKTFTSLLLADMIEKGEVKADDPVAKFLPANVKVPSRNGRQITLLDLSMQMSALPRLPDNLDSADPLNPYADYTAAKLYDFLSHYTLTRDPGEKYEYSNLGAGLLGHALALKAGLPYEELLKRRILEPLGMTSTSVTLSESQKKRLAPGYDAGLSPTPNWDFDVLAGCGALRSTAHDLLRFVAANLGLTDTPLKAALLRMRSIEKPTGTADVEIALGWHISTRFGGKLYWHNGASFGYRGFLGFDPVKKEGVVILCNTFLDNDDLGRHVLDSRYPVLTYHKAPEVLVDQAILASYVGEYEFTPQIKMSVTREGSRLFVQLTGQPRLEVFAKSDTEFYLKVVTAGISFEKDALILHQNGRDQQARKVK